MKVVAIIFLCLAVVTANPVAVEDWQLIPDEDNNLHLVDVNAIVEPEPAFNAWTDVHITLFTRSNPTGAGQLIVLNNIGSLQNSNFNANHQNRFLVHGWNGNHNAAINTLSRNAYLGRGDFNVFVVNWAAGAQTANYVAARNRVGDVGNYIANVIDWLNLVQGAQFSSMTVTGHSLGAHVAGFAGKHVTRGRIQNIVGLDPALPLFLWSNPNTRMASTDGIYVESIQTDIGQLGFDQPLGQATFYPNWGINQPGCNNNSGCSHGRAVNFFAESITTPTGFYGTRCSGFAAIQGRSCPSTGSSAPMGGEPVLAANGVFFMTTNAASPFGQGWRP